MLPSCFRLRIAATLLAGAPAPIFAAAPAPFAERDGVLEFEAEAAHAVVAPEHWQRLPATRGEAMKVVEAGPWRRHLRYDLRFATPGTYRLWLLARKNPAAPRYQGNDLKVFLYPADAEQPIDPKRIRFEVGMKEQREFRWLDWPKNSPTNTTDLVVPAAGLYHFYLVGGAGEEWGWEVDAVRLTKDNAAPPPGGAAPYAEPAQAPQPAQRPTP
jgi:hypothetical protein